MNYTKLQGSQKMYLVPQGISVQLTGVKYAAQDSNGKIILTYLDSTEECAECPEYDITDKTIFEVVGDVQRKARA